MRGKRAEDTAEDDDAFINVGSPLLPSFPFFLFSCLSSTVGISGYSDVYGRRLGRNFSPRSQKEDIYIQTTFGMFWGIARQPRMSLTVGIKKGDGEERKRGRRSSNCSFDNFLVSCPISLATKKRFNTKSCANRCNFINAQMTNINFLSVPLMILLLVYIYFWIIK